MVQGVPGPWMCSLLILSDVVWYKLHVFFTVPPTCCRGKHLLDICTWARAPVRGCDGVLPVVRGLGCLHLSSAYPGWWQVQGTRIVMFSVLVAPLDGGARGPLLHSLILLAHRDRSNNQQNYRLQRVSRFVLQIGRCIIIHKCFHFPRKAFF